MQVFTGIHTINAVTEIWSWEVHQGQHVKAFAARVSSILRRIQVRNMRISNVVTSQKTTCLLKMLQSNRKALYRFGISLTETC